MKPLFGFAESEHTLLLRNRGAGELVDSGSRGAGRQTTLGSGLTISPLFA